MSMLWCFVILCSLDVSWTGAAGRGDYGELKLFHQPLEYKVQSTVLFYEAERTHKEVGQRLTSTLQIRPLINVKETEIILQFDLLSPTLHMRGKHPHADWKPRTSLWDAHAHTTFYTHWKHGVIDAVYLKPKEAPDVTNYHKALASLFQFQVLDVENNETDVSGHCDVIYESPSLHTIRKVKRNCIWAGTSDVTDLKSRYISRYTLSETLNSISTLHAEEIHEAGAIKVRTFTNLELGTSVPKVGKTFSTVQEAIAALPEAYKATTLQIDAKSKIDSLFDNEESNLAFTIKNHGAACADIEEAGKGGRGDNAAAALRVLAALHTASAKEIVDVLNATENLHLLDGLLRLVGVSGSRASWQTARSVTHSHTRDPSTAHAQHYLAGLALAPTPDPFVVLEVLKVAETGSEISAAALLSASAAAAKTDDVTQRTVLQALTSQLARCKDDSCRYVRLHALGNLQHNDAAGVALEHAERGNKREAGAALTALRNMPHPPRGWKHRLAKIVLNPRRPLTIRVLALDLILTRSTKHPEWLGGTVRTLHDTQAPHELRRILWQKLHALADQHEGYRKFVDSIPANLKHWNNQACSGTSSALERFAGSAMGWSAALRSLQVASGGLLQRGTTALSYTDSTGVTLPALEVEVWTSGLDSLAGGGGDDLVNEVEEDESGTEGGLAITVGTARMSDVVLFSSQSELIGHVWAGTASSPTPVVRALHATKLSFTMVPLLTGALLQLHTAAALDYALDAQAQISMWSRVAKSGLTLRGGGAVWRRAGVRGEVWGDTGVEEDTRGGAELAIDANVDFYDQVALCVRSQIQPYTYSRNVTLRVAGGGPSLRVRRSVTVGKSHEGRTLSLGTLNDRMCRQHAPAGGDAD